jgi:hypothetical protein
MPTDSREIQQIRRDARLRLALLPLSLVVAVSLWAAIGWSGYAAAKWLASWVRESGANITIVGVLATALAGASIIWLADLGDDAPRQ